MRIAKNTKEIVDNELIFLTALQYLLLFFLFLLSLEIFQEFELPIMPSNTWETSFPLPKDWDLEHSYCISKI